ncbi:Ger(x)C family spore germination protein [Cohnella faecalis]|uniref:Ger(x)C family spore germination protein n=1 Tax=Cohnella faecalis TaxID=2315694 RepID=UPI00131483FC|nr:hypothetical protein [Cohnella faecalis]
MSLRRWLACAALLGLTLCGGCGFKDIDKRFFVIATGIDLTGKTDTPYRVTLRLAIPYTKTESGEAHTEVETIEGASVAEAIRKLKSHVDKELDFAHCRVILLGKSLAEAGFADSIEWMSRRRDIQQIAYLGIAMPDANSLLKVKIKSERYPGNAFFLMFGKEGPNHPSRSANICSIL